MMDTPIKKPASARRVHTADDDDDDDDAQVAVL